MSKSLVKEQWKDRVVGFERRPAKDFQANALNFRRHPNNQRDAFRGIVSELGFAGAVLENTRTGNLIDGHLRIEEALSIDDSMLIPCVQVDLSEAEEKLLLASYDPLSAMATADKETLDLLLKDVSTGDEAVNAMLAKLAEDSGLSYGAKEEDESKVGELIDKAAELQQKWQVVTGGIYQIGKHRLMCGDATSRDDVARVMDGEIASLLATDPPYNVGIEYGEETDDSKLEEVYEAFSRAWFEVWASFSMRQIVTPGCNNLARWCRYFEPYHVAPWTKTNAMTNGKVARWWCWEPMLFFGENWKRGRSNDVFDFPVPPQKAAGMGTLTPYHPCPKPLPMYVDLIANYSAEGEIIADAFVGSGTTMVAAEQERRICYAMDIEAKYVAVTLERMTNLGLEARLTPST